VAEIAAGFDGPLALVASGKSQRIPLLEAGSLILVPVNGTAAARRAAEVAFALARPHRLRVKALYVSPAPKGVRSRASISRSREEAVLKDIVELAERYEVLIQTAMRARSAPDVAICQEAAKGAAMIVIGASQRAGEELFFGNTANAILATCKCPIMLIASERVQRSEPNTGTAREEKSEAALVKSEKAA
jgi:nucleotide-binding universal stress UspA family protein